MNQYADYFKQAELALAAYGNFAAIVPTQQELEDADFSISQAENFILNYRVVDQYNDPNTGLSATIFRHTNDIYNTNSILAIRGTEIDDINDLFAGLSIALIGDTTKLQPQYTNLKAKVTEWLTNGTISPTFTVTGHSLGGFLATGLTTDFPGNVSHAYLYNTPGVGGVFGSMTNAILDFLGIAQTYDPGKFSNIEAATGISPIAGLGYDVSPPIDIIIENQWNPDVTNAPASKNHSQQVLTDTLAVYSLYSQLLPSFDQNQLNSLINAFGSIKDTQGTSNSTTIESALDALRTIVLNPGNGQIILDDTHKTGRGDREAFYTNFESLNGNQALLTLSSTV